MDQIRTAFFIDGFLFLNLLLQKQGRSLPKNSLRNTYLYDICLKVRHNFTNLGGNVCIFLLCKKRTKKKITFTNYIIFHFHIFFLTIVCTKTS